MSAELLVAVVDPDPRWRDEAAAPFVGGPATAGFASMAELEDRVPAAVPTVAVLGPGCADPSTLGEVERVMTFRPHVGAVLLAGEFTTDVLQRALRAGVRDVLPASADAASVREAVARVAASLAPGRPVVAPEAPATRGRLITVFSTKGGNGKSVVASNLAVVLQGRSERPVALVDADLQFGDVAILLQLSPQHTVVDAAQAIDRLDAPMLQSLLVKDPATGLLVLPAPLEPALAEQVSARDMVDIVDLLQTFCAYVVVDTPAYFNDVVLGLIEHSDDVLMVAGLDVPNVKNVKVGLQTLRLLNTPSEKLRLVLNRANSQVKLDVAEVERALQVKADCLLPSDIAVPQSVNRGVPLALSAPKSDFTKAIETLADLFAPAPPRKRRWR